MRSVQIHRMSRLYLCCLALILALAWSSTLRAQSRDLAGIAHVAFRVSDLEASRNFYENLGFEQVFELTNAGNVVQAFLKINDHQFIELYPQTDESQPIGLMHVCFEANDIEAVRNAYVQEGMNPPQVIKTGVGNLLLVFQDPEGQTIEYLQYMPGSRQWVDRGNHLGDRVGQRLIKATMAAHDPGSERSFYVTKLGFEPASGMELAIPGGSGESVSFQPATATAEPRIVIAVADVRSAARELRRRGLSVRKERNAVSVKDPDRTVVVFATDGKLSSQSH